MRNKKRNRIFRRVGTACIAVLTAVVFSSCERIYEDLDPCRHGVSLRFVYDYNMLYANAFPKSVDCLTVLIYDEEDRYVDSRVVTGKVLQDESYRLTLDLAEGNYHVVAYGGLACDKHSFSMVEWPVPGTPLQELKTAMDADCLTNPDRKNLHGFYWGELSLATGDDYREGVVPMMKNTNNIRIVLQHMNGDPVDDQDFEFEITDDNTLFGFDNELIGNGTVAYTPWTQGQASTGVLGDGKVVVVAYAEFSTSRLRTKNSPKLRIRRRSDSRAIVDIPLNNYLLLLKSELYSEMGPQEYLDRESEWALVFFLDPNDYWIRTFIQINDWTVRINDME